MLFLYLAIIFLVVWALFSFYYLFSYKGDKNPYLVRSIPSIFTTIGILGTFLGIAAGLFYFDTNELQNSIAHLLDGLRIAFLSSIMGIVLALIFGRIVEYKVHKEELVKKEEKVITVTSPDELLALNKIIGILSQQGNNTALLEEIHLQLSTKIPELVEGSVEHTKKQLDEAVDLLKKQNDAINLLDVHRREENIVLAEDLEELNEMTLKSVEFLQKISDSQIKQVKNTETQTQHIVGTMNQNHQQMAKRMEEFAEALRKNNAEALVGIMRKITEDFSKQMNLIIQTLVKKNFEELNDSVKNLNEWQQQNKKQMHQLVIDYKTISAHFEVTAQKTKEISEYTHLLVSDESQLSKMIEELQKVLIEDQKFADMTKHLVNTVQKLDGASTGIHDSSIKLDNFVSQHYNLVENTKLLLQQIQEFKNIESDVWRNTRKSLNDAVSQIDKTTTSRDREYTKWLETTLSNLDLIIKRFMQGNN